MNCPTCGYQTLAETKRCPNCGSEMTPKKKEGPKKPHPPVEAPETPAPSKVKPAAPRKDAGARKAAAEKKGPRQLSFLDGDETSPSLGPALFSAGQSPELTSPGRSPRPAAAAPSPPPEKKPAPPKAAAMKAKPAAPKPAAPPPPPPPPPVAQAVEEDLPPLPDPPPEEATSPSQLDEWSLGGEESVEEFSREIFAGVDEDSQDRPPPAAEAIEQSEPSVEAPPKPPPPVEAAPVEEASPEAEESEETRPVVREEASSESEAPSGSPWEVSAPGVAEALVPAGFVRRVAAYLVDAVLLLVLAALFVLLAALASGAGLAVFSVNNLIGPLLLPLLGLKVLLDMVYYVGCHAILGRTPGKALLGLDVRGLDGAPPSAARAWARWLVYWPLTWGLPFGYTLILAGEERQAIHDKVAGTVVTRG